MSSEYDNWERLVAAVIKREDLKHLALCESFNSSISADFSSRFSSEDETTFGASRISNKTIAASRGVQRIKFKQVKKATKNFRSNLVLGEGSFGRVFKGWIDENTFICSSKPGSRTRTVVAIKKWNSGSFQGHEEWLKEVNYLGYLRHPNLVKLLGYCSEEDNMVLVYEFMPNGSLDNHLFRGGHQSLPWMTRIKIAVGVAQGPAFIHGLEIPIIHRSVKTGDILLDGEFNAKLSDFGLARDGPTGDMTHISTRVVSTSALIAPEYAATGQLTTKCDVYSFGVVLLELLSGHPVINNSQNLVEWATPYSGDKRKLLRIMDPKLEGQFPHRAAYEVATIALQCVCQNPRLRPRMADVAVSLEHYV